jgi:Tfp pilus assembly protein PilF
VNRQQRRAAAKGGVAGGKAPTTPAPTADPAGDIARRFAVAHEHHQAGRLFKAEKLYRQILTVDPRHVDSLHFLGVIAYQVGHADDAIGLMRRAVALNDRIPELHGNLGTALQARDRLDEAIASYRRALALKPDFAAALNNIGNVLKAQGRLDEAMAFYQKALAVMPDYAEPHHNLSTILSDQGRPDEAAASYRQAVAIKPDYADAHYNLALALLSRGDMTAGWQEHEWRWKTAQMTKAWRTFAQPQWRGEAADGRTLLIHAEQGFGDTLQFCRYAPLAAARGLRVILEVPERLVRLLHDLPGVDQVVADGEKLPPFDLHCPMLSMPLALETTLATIPRDVPYLHADAAQVAAWRTRLAALEDQGPRIGLVWAGNPRLYQPGAPSVDRRRSITLGHFAAFAGLESAAFISLQKDDAAHQTKTPPAGLTIHDWTAELSDFAATAALIEALDLVIGVDTAVIHLAGALGKPVWLLNRFDSCWRWLLERDDSPWYPTLRQFRQPSPGDWNTVLAKVRAELETATGARPSRNPERSAQR